MNDILIKAINRLIIIYKGLGRTKEETIKEVIKESMKQSKLDMYQEEIFWNMFETK